MLGAVLRGAGCCGQVDFWCCDGAPGVNIANPAEAAPRSRRCRGGLHHTPYPRAAIIPPASPPLSLEPSLASFPTLASIAVRLTLSSNPRSALFPSPSSAASLGPVDLHEPVLHAVSPVLGPEEGLGPLLPRPLWSSFSHAGVFIVFRFRFLSGIHIPSERFVL